jgi:hypothetical protein
MPLEPEDPAAPDSGATPQGSATGRGVARERTGRVVRLGLLGFLGCFLLTGAASFWRANRLSSPRARQPIAFNHKKHVQDLELACSTCHQFYEKESFSGLPDSEVCGACHGDPQGKSKEEAKLVQLLKNGESLQWVPLFRQPAHVFYSHRRHVVGAKLECATCHGAIAQATAPPQSVRRLRMQDCLDCHRRSGVPTDCTTCHR